DADLGAEPLDGATRGTDALDLAQVVGEFLMGPVGPVESLRCRPGDDPAAQLVGQCRGNMARLAEGLLGLKCGKSSVAISVEPAGNRLAVNAQIGGDVLASPTAVGHQDDLEPIPESAVVGGTEAGVKALGLRRGQLNADHGAVPSQLGRGSAE